MKVFLNKNVPNHLERMRAVDNGSSSHGDVNGHELRCVGDADDSFRASFLVRVTHDDENLEGLEIFLDFEFLTIEWDFLTFSNIDEIAFFHQFCNWILEMDSATIERSISRTFCVLLVSR